MEVMYVGHPLAVEIKRENDFKYAPEKKHIALLPGSRKNEVDRILPMMAELIRKMPEYRFTIAAVSHLPRPMYEKWLSDFDNVRLVVDDMKQALQHCEAAVVTSGTATLETALLGVPEIVVYKGTSFSYHIAKRLIKVNYISLVNLIMNKELIPELIQSACNPENMYQQLMRMMQPDVAEQVKAEYHLLTELLTSGGGASAAAVDIISDIRR
jgi:lipid-A-disaccharide synthase